MYNYLVERNKVYIFAKRNNNNQTPLFFICGVINCKIMINTDKLNLFIKNNFVKIGEDSYRHNSIKQYNMTFHEIAHYYEKIYNR